MKKMVLSSLLVSVATLALVGNTALAEEKVTGKTKGDVTFEKGVIEGVTDPLDPDTEITVSPIKDKIEPIVTELGIGITHVPTFHFGEVGVDSRVANYPVKTTQFTEGEGDTARTFFTPNFIQVSDKSGNTGATWSVKVAQEGVFTGKDKANKDVTLTNTRIRLHEKTMNNGTNADGATALTGFDNSVAATPYAVIPTTGSLTVFESKTAGYTNTSTSNLIFKNEYTKADQVESISTSEGVQLNVPSGEKPQIGIEYSANLVWTLETAP